MASLDDQIKDAMKTAMKAKEQTTLQTIRMVRAEMQARLNEAGGPTEPSDALWVEVIQSYQKKLKKSQQTYRELGDAGAEKVKDLDAEIAVLKPFLPQMIEGAELEALLDGIIAKTGATGPRDMGKVMGLLMKDHKGSVDGGQVQQLLKAKLNG